MVAPIKIHKTILSDSLELSGLAQFQGQEVEITITPVVLLKPIAPEQDPVPDPLAHFVGAVHHCNLASAIDNTKMELD
jgi:hypothetical protein